LRDRSLDAKILGMNRNGEQNEDCNVGKFFDTKRFGGGEGILRLAPTWVPRSYMLPGRRLKLDARDLYAYGTHRGGMMSAGSLPQRLQ